MKFGFFDDANREYVITTPKTPYPWINYLGNEKMFGLISNTAGGYSFYKDARLRRITRYRYNNTPLDAGGRYFYINNGGDIWSPGWQPVKAELDKYECRHGMGYTQITGERGGISVSQLCFIPLNTDAEIYKITVKNTSDKAQNFTMFSFLEFCLWNAYDDMTNFQRNFSIGEVEIDGSTIYHKTEYRERRDHYSFYTVNAPIDGFDTDRETFVGMYNGYDAPAVVKAGKATNSVASGWAPVASHQLNISLAAGEEKEYVFMLGYIENPEEEKWEAPGIINKTKAKALIERFSTAEAVINAFNELKDYWTELLSKYTLESGDEKLNRMVNIWNPYQCMITFNMSRSASYFESGVGRGMGFRDSNQDLLGFVHQIPERARERIIDIASTQFEDGSAYHQYQPLTKKGNLEVGSGFNDDPLWLICGTAAYIKETGDYGILDENVPFDNDSDNTASLFEHLRRSFYYTSEHLGPHGLPLIGRADWNDCLNLNCFSKTPGDSFQTTENIEGKVAESIFIAGMFVYIGPEFVELCKKRGLNDEAEKAQALINQMEKTVIENGYDGEWYLRAYDAFGDKVGSKDCEEGKIFIEPQGMCGMAGIGKEQGLVEKALDSVVTYLDTKHGIVLNNPAYTKYYLNLGEISTYPQGYKENAGIFCHNNPWVAMAETVIGRGDRAFEIYSKIAPAYREDISDVHRMEPYVYAQMIAGKDAVRHGEAKNSWLTGTASWNFIAISQAILGVMPDYDGLKVDPCIPKAWKGYNVKRSFRGAEYDIQIVNDAGVSKGVKSVTVDGNAIDSNVIPAFGDGKTHTVVVTMG